MVSSIDPGSAASKAVSDSSSADAEQKTRKALAMLAFLKSELFLRFLGGFAIGAVGVFVLQPREPPG